MIATYEALWRSQCMYRRRPSLQQGAGLPVASYAAEKRTGEQRHDLSAWFQRKNSLRCLMAKLPVGATDHPQAYPKPACTRLPRAHRRCVIRQRPPPSTIATNESHRRLLTPTRSDAKGELATWPADMRMAFAATSASRLRNATQTADVSRRRIIQPLADPAAFDLPNDKYTPPSTRLATRRQLH